MQARVYYAARLYHEGYADKLILLGALVQNSSTEAEARAVAATALDVRVGLFHPLLYTGLSRRFRIVPCRISLKI
ncbi:MAG: hypothetical protein AB1796_10480 [Bacillota bacterium]